MGIELTFKDESSAGLVERVPLEEISPLLRSAHDYTTFLRRAKEAGAEEAYVHYSVGKIGRNARTVDITGVSLNKRLNQKDIHEGRAFDCIGPGAIKYAEQRSAEIKKLLGYRGDLYPIIFSPNPDRAIVDSRRELQHSFS